METINTTAASERRGADNRQSVLLRTLPWAAPMLLGGVLIFFRLGGPSLWLDEIMSADFSDGTLTEMWTWLQHDVHGPLSFLAQMATLRLLPGHLEFALRLPDALAGVATIGLTYCRVLKLGGRALAWRAALLLSVMPLFVEFAREGRPHMPATLLGVASWLALTRLIESPRRATAIFYGVLCGLIGLTFYMGLLNVTAQGLLWLVLARRHLTQRHWRALPWAVGAALLVFLPWASTFHEQMTSKQTTWMNYAHYFPQGITGRDLLTWWHGVLWGTLVEVRPWRAWVGLAFLAAALAAIGMLATRGRGSGAGGEGFWAGRPWGATLMTLAPMALFVLYCLHSRMLLARYMVVVLPGLALMLAQAIFLAEQSLMMPMQRKGTTTTTGLITAALTLCFLTIYPGMLHALPRTDWRRLAQWLATHVKPGDQPAAEGQPLEQNLIVTDNPTSRSCLIYYLPRTGGKALENWMIDFGAFHGLSQGRFIAPHGQMFFIAAHLDQNGPQLAELGAKNILLQSTGFFHGLKICVYQRLNP